MAKKFGKRYRADFETIKQIETLPLPEAISTVLNFKKAKFDQSIDICMHLGVDPKHADQMIRGSLSLPPRYRQDQTRDRLLWPGQS